MNKKILIVDDDEIYNFICKETIKRISGSNNIDDFTSSTDALEFLNKINEPEKMPDIILIDINMPVLDGWGFIEELKKNNNFSNIKTKIFIQSSSVYVKDTQKANDHEMVSGFITKPLTIEQVQMIYN
ncbi:MAG: response regulator [Cytophagales bacterium]